MNTTNIINVREYYKNGHWVDFAHDVLGVRLDIELQEILEAIQNNRRISVRSGHARGKDFVAAVASLCFLYLNIPSKVINTAPCYDDKTEILTDSGWKLFADVTYKDTVAQKGNNNKIEFVKPLDIIVEYYKGAMIGCRSQLIDFLVTPKHRCLFDRDTGARTDHACMVKEYHERKIRTYGQGSRWKEGWSQYKTAEALHIKQSDVSRYLKNAARKEIYNGDIYHARAIYGRNGRFNKIATWEGKGEPDIGYYELLGFWFAEGSAQFNKEKRKYRITLTQLNDIEYVDELLLKNKDRFKNKWHKYKRKDGGYNWELYDIDVARVFVEYGKAKTKKVPQFIKDANVESLKAFIKGYCKGDGSIDKNGSIKLTTASEYLANDLHEMCIKAGIISNKRKYKVKNRKIINKNGKIIGTELQDGYKYIYDIKIWNKRGYYPNVKKNNWYKEYYKGKVYSITVPTGMVMVRRDGKNHWSGNTNRQVVSIMMSEISKIHNNAKIPLGGEVLTQKIRFEGSPDWSLEAFKAADKDIEAWSGFHSPNLMVVITEASGIDDITINAVEGILTGNSKLLIVFNHNRLTGFAHRSTTDPLFKKFTLNCLDAPNVKADKIIYPGQIDKLWISEKIQMQGWVTEIDEAEMDKTELDFQWEGKYYRPGDLFRVKVLGREPKESEEQMYPITWIEASHRRWRTARGKGVGDLKLGVDVAGQGRDKTAFVYRRGNIIEKIKTWAKSDLMVIVGMIKNELKSEKDYAYIDTIGEGAGVYSRCTEQKMHVYSCKGSYSAKDLHDMTGERTFLNMRAYGHWALRDALDPQFGDDIALPPDDELTQELLAVEYDIKSNGDIFIKSKDEIKILLGRSPDKADAVVNLFYKITKTRPRAAVIG